MQYLVCEISGRQYLIKPNQMVEVDNLGEVKDLEIDKVLLSVDNDTIEIGKPYLDRKVKFEVLGNVQKQKIRVATYKAKANYRRVKGSRATKTQIKLAEGKE